MIRTIAGLILGVAFLGTGCVSQDVASQREAALNEWLMAASKPVQVVDQSIQFRCAPGYFCYTFIDQEGKTLYVKNIRQQLPAVIPAAE